MPIELNPDVCSDEAREIEQGLLEKVAGQDAAVRKVARAFQVCLADMAPPGRPHAVFLMLGPTGTGKTYLVESAAELVAHAKNAVLKVDCGEYQAPHEISKLIGSPPGYIGHEDTPPLFSPTNVQQKPFVLFDEIEKANETLRRLMLGILDKGTVRLGTNETVDFTNTFVFMTSNLGAREIENGLRPRIGFAARELAARSDVAREKDLEKIGIRAVRQEFSPEFMNRLDDVIVFNALTRADLDRILDLELTKVQNRILASTSERKCVFHLEDSARAFLLQQGYDPKYGARNLKRVIEKHVVFPLSALIASRQIALGDIVEIKHAEGGERLSFAKDEGGALIGCRSMPASPEPRPRQLGNGN
jgi:ATP-dependent Clp protease ATP-binding subunit ClpA